MLGFLRCAALLAIVLAPGVAGCVSSARGSVTTPPLRQGPTTSSYPDDPALARILGTADLDGRALSGDAAPVTVLVSFASWCGHCHTQLDRLAAIRARHPRARILGLNYEAHEAYDGRGDAEAVRAYVARFAPWLRVVPIGDAAFSALGRPPKVPTVFVYDSAGALVETFDRRDRPLPDVDELDRLLTSLGA